MKLLIGILILWLAGMVGCGSAPTAPAKPYAHPTPPESASRSLEETTTIETRTVKTGWYCSPGSEDDAAQLNLAIAHQDMLAAAGHVKRNGAFQLETGTKVQVAVRGASSLSLVRVTAGYHDGQSCWLPSSMVR